MGSGRYWRDISAILGLKALAIGLIYLLFFANPDGPSGPATVFQHLISSGGAHAGATHD